MVDEVRPGALYRYRLDDGRELPDPASRHQPEGVHGPSAVVEPAAFHWSDGGWRGLGLDRLVLYELHVGTYTPEGTFDAVVPRLRGLRELGVTAVELMPIAQFPGSRNWGYDGAFPWAAQASYGGPAGLARLVDACHREGLGVVLDVVYNHLGPDGNDLGAFAPYFSEQYRTPWGPALNFDGPGSDEVRRFFLGNALWWLEALHVDGFRLDAADAIHDRSARPFLAELAQSVHDRGRRLGRGAVVIAESDRNDARLVLPPERGGMGLDAQWSEDFHHALHVVLTGERAGYYGDYHGIRSLGGAMRQGFAYTGQHSAYRGHRRGGPPGGCAGRQFVVYAQNHDQTGNRPRGERLAALVPPAGLRLAAATVLLSPFTPLLFMGEEYGETAPFPYFTSHGDAGLVAAVREGRRRELRIFGWREEPLDPQAESTYELARLAGDGSATDQRRTLLAFYRELLRLRQAVAGPPAPEGTTPARGGSAAAADRSGADVVVLAAERVLFVRRGGMPARGAAGSTASTAWEEAVLGDAASSDQPSGDATALPAHPGSHAARSGATSRWPGGPQVAYALAFDTVAVEATLPLPAGRWRVVLDSSDARWGGSGATVPAELDSAGAVRLRLPPLTCVVWAGGVA